MKQLPKYGYLLKTMFKMIKTILLGSFLHKLQLVCINEPSNIYIYIYETGIIAEHTVIFFSALAGINNSKLVLYEADKFTL